MKGVSVIFCLFVIVFTRAQELKPNDKLALLNGKVTNFKGKALANEIILFINEKTNAVTKVNTDDKGLFRVLIPNNASYVMKYKNFTTDMEYTKMVISADKEASYEVEIKIDPPKEFVLTDVHFETGKATLLSSSGKSLNDLAEVLKMKRNMRVEIQGHTDNVGSPAENLQLSQKRAEAVRNFLLSKGINPERVSAKGYGQEQPVADNDSEKGRAMNRRTGLKVLSE